jgi:hypothetical protein
MMTRTAVAAALLLTASAPLAQAVAPPVGPPATTAPDLQVAPPALPRGEKPPPATAAKKPLPRAAVLDEVSGVLRAVSPADHRLTIQTAGGDVSLGFDRNTMVYTSSGLGTVRDLVPGVQLRAGRNADMLAYWVLVRPASPAGTATSTPGQGTGPGGGSPGPTEGPGGAGNGGATAPGSAPGTAPGSAPGTPPGGNVGPGSVGPSTTPSTGGAM